MSVKTSCPVSTYPFIPFAYPVWFENCTEFILFTWKPCNYKGKLVAQLPTCPWTTCEAMLRTRFIVLIFSILVVYILSKLAMLIRNVLHLLSSNNTNNKLLNLILFI